jgi:hypothetical protein
MSRIKRWFRRSDLHDHIDAVARRLSQENADMSSKLQGEIDRLKTGLAANTSATAAMTDLFSSFLNDVRENADDAEEIRAIADAYEANTATLVAAAAQGTPAQEGSAPVSDTSTASGADAGGQTAGGDGEASTSSNDQTARQ